MFKDLQEGTTHYENDGCGIKEHNMPKQNKEDWKIEWVRNYGRETIPRQINFIIILLEQERIKWEKELLKKAKKLEDYTKDKKIYKDIIKLNGEGEDE